MEQLLVAREVIVKFFKRYEVFIMPILKFLMGFYVFSIITSIGGMNAGLAPFADSFSPGLLNLLFAILFTIMPMNMSWIVIILTTTLQFSGSLEVAVAVFVFLMLVFLFYARMAPKESILILFTIIAFRFNVPYLVPILAGIYFPVTAIIPVTVGVFVHANIAGLLRISLPATANVAANSSDRDLSEILGELPSAFSDIYSTLMGGIAPFNTWIFTAIIFSMVIVLVYFVSRQAIDFAKEIAIGLGCVMMIFGFIVSVLFSDGTINIGLMILGTVICGCIALLVRFLDGILDYQRAESVQFEDDNNYYHVRIVPKVIMTKAQRSVKRIRPETASTEPEDEDES
ncbi:MAG: hypothetical protein FWF78_02980 [Defluviitaleaceae bacterium]|nr:hypothetical protein [Defluviitaleaceae bacterium]